MGSPFRLNPLSLSVPDEHFTAWVSEGRSDGDEMKLIRRSKSGRNVELRRARVPCEDRQARLPT